MDSWEFNKIAGGVLGTLLFVIVISLVAEGVYHVEKPAKPGYVVEGVVEDDSHGGTAAAPAAEPMPDFGTVLATADAAAGENVAKRCLQCHEFKKGGPNKTGPDLWGIVGHARASHAGFAYSSAMKADTGPWTFDKLFTFLKSPQAAVPGTKMSFAGIRSVKDRLDLLAYMRMQADSPAPLPPPNPAAATAEAPAPGTTPAPGATPAAGTPPSDPAKPAAPAGH